MTTRKSLILLALIIAIVALFAVTEVIAQQTCNNGICPDTCQAGPYTIKIVEPFPLVINESITVEGTTYTCDPRDPNAGYPCKIWAWEFIAGDTSKVSFLNMLIPVCCTTQIEVVSADPSLPGIFEPCEGDTSSKWAKDICDDYTIRLAAQAINNEHKRFWIATNMEAIPGLTSMLIKQGNKEYPCKNLYSYPNGGFTGLGGIAGPDCELELERPVGASSSGTECITIDTNSDYPISMSLTRDPVTGYALIPTILFYRSVDCSGTGEAPGVSTPLPLVFCTGGTGDKLNECIKLEAVSPGCVDYYVGAKLCHWCW